MANVVRVEGCACGEGFLQTSICVVGDEVVAAEVWEADNGIDG